MQIDIAAVESAAGLELAGPPLRARSWLRKLDAAFAAQTEAHKGARGRR
ncbi:hypothetical protein ACTXGI_12475 [Psychrobacter sp. T6-2]